MTEYRYEYPIETIVNAGPDWSRFVDDPTRAGQPIDDVRVIMPRRWFGHILDPEIVLAETLRIEYTEAADPVTGEIDPFAIVKTFLVRDSPLPDAIRPVRCPVCDADGWLEHDPSTRTTTSDCPFGRNSSLGIALCHDGWCTAIEARTILYLLAGESVPITMEDTAVGWLQVPWGQDR